MTSLIQTNPGTSQAGRLLGTPMPVTFYRRSSTCKAPRKRVALLTLQKRGQKSVCTAGAICYGYGGNGPNGPTSNTRSWGAGDGGFSNGRGNTPITTSPAALAVMLAGMVLWGMQAGPAAATAGAMTDSEEYFQYDSSMALVQTPGAFAEVDDECVCGDGFTAEEKELLAPKQYHVREWVFVH